MALLVPQPGGCEQSLQRLQRSSSWTGVAFRRRTMSRATDWCVRSQGGKTASQAALPLRMPHISAGQFGIPWMVNCPASSAGVEALRRGHHRAVWRNCTTHQKIPEEGRHLLRS